MYFIFFKQKTAYEMRISDWSSDVCSSDLSEGLSLTRPSMYFSLGGLVLLIPLGYVLMFGKLGIPPQGAHGCGVATAIVLWLEMLALDRKSTRLNSSH